LTSMESHPWWTMPTLSSPKFGWLIPQQVILSVAKDLDGQGDSSLRSETMQGLNRIWNY